MSDCTLMSRAGSLICHHHLMLVSTRLLIFTFCVNICKMTINVTIIFKSDLLVSLFAWLLPSSESPNQIFIFINIFSLSWTFALISFSHWGEEAFWLVISFLCSQLIVFFVCVFFVADFIHEQDRPLSRQDFTLWATPAVIPATV